jgi:transcriptional regulator with XRE-family HTH domain
MLRLTRRVRQQLGWPVAAGSVGGEEGQGRLDPLLQAGRTLREARESRGIGLRQLAQATRISTAVLEALERGWADRLPEPAYLRTMLPLLEQALQLPSGSLNGALPRRRSRSVGPQHRSVLERFSPDAIDLLSTWQGALAYGLLTLGLLYGLNLQQQKLALRGLLSTHPIPPLTEERSAEALASAQDLARTFPDLSPLRRASEGQALRRLQGETGRDHADLSLGRLQLQLDRPTRVALTSRRSGATTLEAVQGSLDLPVLPPFELQLDPAPLRPDGVRWNGTALPAADASAGSYRYPALARPVPPSAPRP